MTTTTLQTVRPVHVPTAPVARAPRARVAFATLARRRLALSARTPRELLVPLLTPVLFAVVIAPALAKTVGVHAGGVDYMTFVAVSTIGLLVPLSCMVAGIGVIIDRDTGARRDLLAAPIPRRLLVLANLAVALVVSSLQLVALFVAAVLRGADFHVTGTGVLWFVGTALLFAVAMYGVAETLANRIPSQEEYIGALPAVAIVPWFFAGSLFRISALPSALTTIAKIVPLTHVLALMRYALVDPRGSGLHDIWGMHDVTTMAFLSLGVVAVFAAVMTTLSIRVFTRAALH